MSMSNLRWPNKLQEKRKIKAGDVFGTVHVLEVDEDGEKDSMNRPRWIVRFGCCGREVSYSYSRIKGFRARPPATCHVCKPEEPEAPVIIKMKAEGKPIPGVRIAGTGAGAGFWPFIQGPMGPRWGGNGCNANRLESSV